jgi:hypothetical protein
MHRMKYVYRKGARDFSNVWYFHAIRMLVISHSYVKIECYNSNYLIKIITIENFQSQVINI